MKYSSFLLLIAGLVSSYAADTAVRSFMLDEFSVRVIPVSKARVTTFCFPSALQAVSGAGFTPDGLRPALFQLDYQPGSFFFAVRALAPGASANLNVVWNRRIYVFELVETNVPALSVLLEAPATTMPFGASATSPATPTRLLGLLQRAKAFPYLAQHHPTAVRGATLTHPNRVLDFGDFSIQVNEVFRFEAEDALVFQVQLENKTDMLVHYEPGSFAVRVGDRLFHQAISDASGLIPPKTIQPAWFVIAGALDGSRLDLSLKNDFVVLVTRQMNP